MQPEKIYRLSSPEEIADSLKYILKAGDLLLVKGSRGVQMERVVKELKKEN